MELNEKLIGQRLLVTDTITQISRHEWKLLEVSLSGKCAKFSNGTNDFWTDVDKVSVLEVLPTKP